MAYKRKVALFVGLWVVLGVVTWMLVRYGYGPWIELFNGATWPGQFVPTKDSPPPEYDFGFYVVVSLRALLNLGVLFTVFLVVTGQWKGLLMSKFNSTYRSANVLLAEHIINVLAEQKVNVPPPALEAVRRAAEEFGDSSGGNFFRKRTEDAAKAAH